MGIPRGTAIGSVVVEQPLAREGEELYRGRQRGLEREVTVRVLPRDRKGSSKGRGSSQGDEAERFWREARFAARIAHPNVLQVFDCLARDGDVFLVREHVDGSSLRESLDRARDSGSQRLRPDLAARITLELAVALEQLHLHSVVHTGLRPESVLVSRRGELKLDGLGGAREPGESPPNAASLDPLYAAPELLRGSPVDPRADVYSLGAMLEELVSGRAPGSAYTEGPRRLRRLIRACRAPSPALRPRLPEVMDRLRDAAGRIDARAQRTELASWLWQVRVRSRAQELRTDEGEKTPDPSDRRSTQTRRPLLVERRPALLAAVVGMILLASWGVAALVTSDSEVATPAVSAAPPSAALTLAVYPWARVVIDGEESFYTPRAAPVELSPGSHVVVLDHPQHGQVRRVLELEAGEHRILRHAFSPRDSDWSLR